MPKRRLRLVALPVLVVLAAVAGCQTGPVRSASAPPKTWQRVALGWCEDYPEETRTLQAAERDLQRARESGARVLRIAFGWDAMEPERGVYDWSFWDQFVPIAVERHGLRLIPYVCYTPQWAAQDGGENFWRSPPRDPEDFRRFVAALTARYGRWIDSWELWNEPDNPAYWTGDTEDFAALVRAGSDGVRQGDPGAEVVLGGLAWNLSFLRDLLEDHAIAPAIDVVNVHSYFETWHADAIETLPNYLSEAAEIIAAHGDGEPLWMAEVGYSSRGNSAQTSEVYRPRYDTEHTMEAQASALARTLVVALATERLSLLAWYRINDLPPSQEVIGDDNNLHLGLFDVTGRPKPALETYRRLTRLFEQPFRANPALVSVLNSREVPVDYRAFELVDGRALVAVWLPATDSPARTGPESDPRHATIRLRVHRPRAQLLEAAYAPARSTISARSHGSAHALDIDVPLHGGDVALLLIR